MRKYIECLENSKLFLARVTGINFSAKEMKYHAYWRIKNQTEAEEKVNQKQRLAGKDIPTEERTSVWNKSREIHKQLSEGLVSYMEEIVLAKFVKINSLLLFLYF